ncbi:hypothetical protein M885DRAFT_549673 [Pelagophyceae sp. CCMP2097]|nr:hypothetical protein M885DRAFT_549673 [Pelagophyceae sp. CCMP2097]|mmetsp:Transcript_588/g.1904  ORF Transcript_588/g.1904 Transcript_588/m.1904 type:complete len:803 (-) Transcript_588:78-2486(-)
MVSSGTTFSAEGQQSLKAHRNATLNEAGGATAAASYVSDSAKEAMCREYVRNFDHKFRALFPDRRELLLLPPNEFGVPKFVCTTLRPTLLPYREVYDLLSLATFVANYLQYEPLEHPDDYPAVLPSPTQVLEWKVADCFDFSVLLTSYLLGAGYDAYVVYGYAPTWVCLKDQSQTPCPEFDDFAPELPAPPKAEVAPFAASARGAPQSKYVAKQQSETQQATEAPVFDDGAESEPAADATPRLHAWVLVKGFKRDVQGMVFVEPTTGRVFDARDAPYSGVEAVWNAKNYWVNMQGDEPAGRLDFDLANSDLWEYVFIDPATQGGAQADAPEASADGAPAWKFDEDTQENLLDIPPSWVSKLSLHRTDFALCYPPDGQRTTLYQLAKVELFAENTHGQGMTLRRVLYRDAARTVVRESQEKFVDRRDKLQTRVRLPLEGKLVENFLPGRLLSLRQLVEFTGHRRELYFYVEARQDGLVCRQDDIGNKIIERFEGRPDLLEYRSVSVKQDRTTGSTKPQYTLPGGEAGGELVVHKMTQKFGRRPGRAADDDVAKRTYYVQEGRIRTQFHYDEFRITRPTHVHVKERGAAAAAAGRQGKDSANADDSVESVQHILAAERDCLTDVRRSQSEMLDLLKTRRKEEAQIAIDRPIFESAREQHVEDSVAEATVESQDAIDRLQVDYLTPFLQHVGDLADVAYDEAQHARDSCLKSLRERLIERANIIMTRLNEENAKLSKKQATFQRNQRDNDPQAEEDFEKFCSEAMFRIQILEQRLASHEETALRKFQDLDEKLAADPRLRILEAA